MEGIHHVDVAQVGGGGLVGHVDGMVQRQIPDGEGLELGVARLHSPELFVVDLRQAGAHLAGVGSGADDGHDGTGGLHIFVGAVAVLADDGVHVGGVAFDGAMEIDADPLPGQAVEEEAHAGLVAVAGDHHGLDFEAPLPQVVDGAHGVGLVGKAEVGAHLLFFDGSGVDADDDVHLVPQPLEQFDLGVGVESGEDPGGVVIADEFTAEFEIEFSVEPSGPGEDRLGLFLQIFFAVKSDFHVALLVFR